MLMCARDTAHDPGRIDRLFSHVKMRALVQAQRFVVFTLVDRLVAAHRQGIFSAIRSCVVRS